MDPGNPSGTASRSWWNPTLKSIPRKAELESGPGHPPDRDHLSKGPQSRSPRNARSQHSPPYQYDSALRDSSRQIPLQDVFVKPEPSESLNKLSLADYTRLLPHSSDPTRPCKRPAVDPDRWPNKSRPQDDGGSASPHSGLYENAYSNAQSPPAHSSRTHSPSGYRSTQRTPLSSPKLNVSMPQQSTRYPSHDVEKKPFDRPISSVIASQEVPSDQDTKLLLQPETRPISQEQLVNEVKGIYSGLVMVEKKCVEICQQQNQSTNKLSNEQWQALIALHRTLLHEHHDFFLASQHPTASPALRRLPTKYAMPARMWRHGIHSFLELLRHRLPQSLEHMLSFVYLAYQMMGLLMESVPTFHETWIECLGDLARYRMAIEEADMRDRENWSNVARMWYNKAADRSPTTGRIQHHLAVLARPNIVRQLFYYSKALVSVIPFVNARDSIMLLFSPFLDGASLPGQKQKPESTTLKYPKFESSLVTAAGIAFTKGSIHGFCVHIAQFASTLDSHITRSGSNWKVQGAEVASSLIACILDFGSDENFLWKAFRTNLDKIKGIQAEKQDPLSEAVAVEDPLIKEGIHRKFWEDGPINEEDFRRAAPPAGDLPDVKFVSPDEVTSYVLPVWSTTISLVAGKVGDRNSLPFLHLTLAFLWSLSYVPGALIYVENYVPWERLVLSLNTLSRSGVVDARVESKEFPQQQSGTGRQLPEDFPMRGLIWAPYYFPADFFEGQVVDEDERTLELPSHAAPRAERCLWLGVRLASLKRYMTYNVQTKQFGATEYALSLDGNASMYTLHVAERDVDEPMTDV